MEYRREIDGLRALAVLPVIWFHAGISAFGGGFVGVDVFFVISGYLITSVLLAELEQGTLTLPGFYERRARRILPALFLVMLVCLPFAWYWLLPIDMKEFSQSLVAVPVFASNIYFWFKSGYFSTASEYRPLIHTWSLAVEEQYYVLFPMVLMLVWKRGQRWILCALGMVFLASMAAAQWAVDSAPDFAFYQLPTRIWELLMGVFAAFYLSQARTPRHTLCRVTQDLGGWTGLVLLVYAIFFFSKATPFPGLYALVPTGGALLVILFATQETTVGRLLGNRAFVGIGLVSYSAYLWHQPLFAFARFRSMDELGQLEFLMLSGLTFVLAYFSWKYVETPFRRTGFMTGRKFFSLGLAFALFFVLVGFLGHITHGFEDRFERALPGDIGGMKFNAYIDEHFFDCEPKPVRQDFFRPSEDLPCKKSQPGRPDIILLGDSHAEHLLPGLAANMPEHNIAYYQLGFGAVPFIDWSKFKPAIDMLVSDPGPLHIILAMHLFGRQDTQGVGLYEGYSDLIAPLLKAGKSITLVGTIPHHNFVRIRLCTYAKEGSFSAACIFNRKEAQRQRMVYDPTLDRLSKDFGLKYIRLDQALCSEQSCGVIKNGTLVYRDNNHLNVQGSMIVGKYLSEQLLSKP